MKYDDRDRLLAEAKAAMERWKAVLLLQEWDVAVLLADNLSAVRAETDSRPRTRRAETRVNVRYWDGTEDAIASEKAEVWDIKETMLHEAFHIRIAELMVNAEDDRLSKETIENIRYEQEKIVNILTRIIYNREAASIVLGNGLFVERSHSTP